VQADIIYSLQNKRLAHTYVSNIWSFPTHRHLQTATQICEPYYRIMVQLVVLQYPVS